MGESGEFWWCMTHQRVESGEDLCPLRDRLGPYPTSGDAERATQRVAERNAAWDAEDER